MGRSRQFFRLRYLSFSLCALLGASSVFWAPRPGWAADGGASRLEALVAYFDDIVFGNEFEGFAKITVLARWQEPLRIALQGRVSERHGVFLKAHLARIRDMTGLAMSQDQKNPNLQYAFMHRNEMANLKGQGIDPEVVRKVASSANCYFLSWRRPEDRFVKAVIVVNVDLPPERINHCLLEETVQALGLPNDSEALRPSLFSDSDMLFEPSRADEILIRTLYDRRLQPGLDRAETLVRARAILADWDKRLPLR